MYRIKKKLPIYRQKQLAKDMGITQQYLSRIQNGKQSCSRTVAYSITKGFDPSAKVEDFFDFVEE